MRLVHWLVTAPVALVLVIFALSNRGTTDLNFWPFDFVLEAPTYLVVLLLLLIGFALGELVAWVMRGSHRRERRAQAKRIAALERELAACQAAKSLPANSTIALIDRS